VLDGFVAAHADAVVADGDRARLGVGLDADQQLAAALEKLRTRQRLEPQLVQRVRSVGNQLAQENLFVAVERMDHQLEQLLDLRLKAHGLRLGLRLRRVAHLDPSRPEPREKCRIIGDAGAYGDPGAGFKAEGRLGMNCRSGFSPTLHAESESG